MRFIMILSATALLFAACGGGDGDDSSGIDPTRLANTLSADEQMTLCEFTIDAAGGAGAEFTCADDVVVTVGTVAECLQDFTATNMCTVAQIEDCATSDPCDLAPCFALLECSGGTQ